MESHWEKESPIEEVHVLSDTVFRTGFLGKRGKLARALDAEIEGDA
jgi:hypothetical protein